MQYVKEDADNDLSFSGAFRNVLSPVLLILVNMK